MLQTPESTLVRHFHWDATSASAILIAISDENLQTGMVHYRLRFGKNGHEGLKVAAGEWTETARREQVLSPIGGGGIGRRGGRRPNEKNATLNGRATVIATTTFTAICCVRPWALLRYRQPLGLCWPSEPVRLS